MLLQRTQVLYLSPIWHQSTPYNFNPKEFSILFCTLEALGIYMTHTGTCRQSTHTHRILLQKIIQMIFKDMKIYKYKCTFSFSEWSSREHLYLLKKNTLLIRTFWHFVLDLSYTVRYWMLSTSLTDRTQVKERIYL